MDLQEQYENLRARQSDLRVVMEQTQQELREDMDRKQAELIQILRSLKHSIDETHLHLQSKEMAENHRHFQKLEDKLSKKWVKSEESCEYYCKSCSAFCSSRRYYRLKHEDLSLCWKCFKNGKFNLETSPSDSVLIESVVVLEDMCLNNIAHKVLDKMPKPVYGAVESDLDALDDMCLPALFNEAERITNAHKVFDGMTGRDHVKLPMDLVEASILQIGKKRLFDNVSGVKVTEFTASWEDRAKHVLISKIEIIALKYDMVLMAFCYKWHMVPKLQEASFGLLPGIIMAFLLGDLLKMNGYSKQVVAISESTITEGARLCGATKITRVDINFNKFEIRKHRGSELAQKVGIGAFNTNYIDTGFFGLYASARPDCLSNLAHCIMLEISKLCYQVLDVGLTRACNQLESSLKQPCWIVLLNATYSWFPFDPGGYSHP
ncbi:putative mitochondrial-processing peptidase subunit beta, mitochondrial [Nicotiana attenuata]|uniref:Mitochondrial-processing peptidase subunit beta, mitochondrial n=1 Tax=Nicotiana attenuata TaxID=49451 RepID=A0A1J6KDQ7_NICAT|nr:putative mitochondrial-processing peptidase subunit beta, mitochondrial [Nicotiana attenuata]